MGQGVRLGIGVRLDSIAGVLVAVCVAVGEGDVVAVFVVVLVAGAVAAAFAAGVGVTTSSAGVGGTAEGAIVARSEARLISWAGTQADRARYKKMTAPVDSLFIVVSYGIRWLLLPA